MKKCKFCGEDITGGGEEEFDEFEFHNDCADVIIEKVYFNKK